MKQWKKVKDTEVQTFWKCCECGEVESVNPDYFQKNGTPVHCDRDMEYTHTEIKLENGKKTS